LRLSLAIRNFSTALKYEQESFQMPMTFDLGTAMDVLRATDVSSNHSLTLAVDGLTAGLGLNQKFSGIDLRIDYGYTDMGSYLGNVHRISLGGSF
jgi:hypothetical protein